MSTEILLAAYSRTPAGDTELESPSNGLSINQRKLLQWADGATTVTEMAERLAAGHTVDAGKVIRDIERLVSTGLLASQGGGEGDKRPAMKPAATLPGKQSGVPKWAYAVGGVVVVIVGFILFGSRSEPVAKAPGQQASAEQGQQEEESKVMGVMPNPARWFSPGGPKPTEQPKPQDQKTPTPTPTKPATPTATPVATPAAKPAAPTVAAAPAATPTVAPTPTPTPTPTQVASAAPAAKPAGAPNTKPIFREQPQFPSEAAREGVDSGSVKARMSVDASGHVTKVEILEARPRRVFERSVTAALMKWRYEPAAAPFTVDTEIDFKAE
ncbi:MAG: TonB family protein [Burkholderiales bacterium]|nr:TonB family protein [Burkholderiales bacterium]